MGLDHDAGALMAKLTIEIDMEDPEENWEALYRRIERFEQERENSKNG